MSGTNIVLLFVLFSIIIKNNSIIKNKKNLNWFFDPKKRISDLGNWSNAVNEYPELKV